MWVYDVESLAFMAVNDAAVRQYGFSRDEFLMMSIRDIRPMEEVPALLKLIASQDKAPSARGGGPFKHRKKDGTAIEVETLSTPIRFLGYAARLVLVSDVTEKRKLEAQVNQSQRLDSIGQLAAGVAHDFNNILGVVTGYAELLRKRLTDERLCRYADDILKAADRAASLTRQLLAFSRKQVLAPRILDLNAVVGDMEKMLRRVIGEDVQLITVLSKEAPRVLADPGQVEQVLMNLAVNARDAMPRGGRLIIETGARRFESEDEERRSEALEGLYAMLSVIDTGVGMPPEVQARIFEPFFTTKSASKGTGLGLATVHGIVKQSGGNIFVHSEPGRGTTFKVYLPAVEAPATPALPSPRRMDDPPQGLETVLLVEDEGPLREIVRESLEASGYTVLPAAHGLAATELCSRHPGPIHLLITDVVMPGMGGNELARLLTEARPDMRVLYMSGYTDDAVILNGVLSADVPYLEKPFTLAHLTQKVRQVLDAAKRE
jgi:PAS domain S-box-containing protein